MSEKIITEFCSTPQLWQAVFDDYDGAPDSHCPIGHGKTKEEAIKDLLERDEEYDLHEEEIRRGLRP